MESTSENVAPPLPSTGTSESLLDKGITTTFYPCVDYEQKLTESADNSFNCPIVATPTRGHPQHGAAR